MKREQGDAPPLAVHLEPNELVAVKSGVQCLQRHAGLIHDGVPEGGVATAVVLGIGLVTNAQLGRVLYQALHEAAGQHEAGTSVC